MARHRHVAVIHCMPGGYSGRVEESDLSRAALYDHGVHAYILGRRGHSLAKAMWARHLERKSRRILDLGCPIGHFALIVSHMLAAETANRAMRIISKEAHRLLPLAGASRLMRTPRHQAHRMSRDFFALARHKDDQWRKQAAPAERPGNLW